MSFTSPTAEGGTDILDRFGGWTEMMRDGADKEGLWELIKTGLE